jgi:hypothetical protein
VGTVATNPAAAVGHGTSEALWRFALPANALDANYVLKDVGTVGWSVQTLVTYLSPVADNGTQRNVIKLCRGGFSSFAYRSAYIG